MAGFGIPAARNVPPAFSLAGVSNFPSIDVRESQFEENYYNVLALQGTTLDGKLDYQTAAFSRYSRLQFNPDPVGDLIFNGVASNVVRSSFANGMQTDAGYKLTDTQTLRGGFVFQGNGSDVKNNATVYPANADGTQPSNVPFTVIDNSHVTEWRMAPTLQDEWRPLDPLTVNFGVRLDRVTAFTKRHQVSPRLAVSYKLTDHTVVHAGYSRYFTPPAPELVQVTDIQKFKNTTNAVASNVNTVTVPDTTNYYDIGANHQLLPGLTLGTDAYYRTDNNLLDEGQFGQALVISPFNYQSGQIFGVEATASFTGTRSPAHANFAYSKALRGGVTSARVQLELDELAFIRSHFVHLDHDQTSDSVGAAYRYRGFLLTATIIAPVACARDSPLRTASRTTSGRPRHREGRPGPYFGESSCVPQSRTSPTWRTESSNGTGIGVSRRSSVPDAGLLRHQASAAYLAAPRTAASPLEELRRDGPWRFRLIRSRIWAMSPFGDSGRISVSAPQVAGVAARRIGGLLLGHRRDCPAWRSMVRVAEKMVDVTFVEKIVKPEPPPPPPPLPKPDVKPQPPAAAAAQ